MSTSPRRHRRPVRPHTRRTLAEAMEPRMMLSASTATTQQDSHILTSPLPISPPAFAAAPTTVQADPGPLYALTVPSLSSLPNAYAKLYLDFDGDPASRWGTYDVTTTPAYDIDGLPTSFSATELANITEIWARVAEKYAPFNIDVTTVRPSNFSDKHAARIVVGGMGAWLGRPAGGVAYVDGFNNANSNTGYVFSAEAPTYLQFVAEGAAHEAGHLFGLQHQSEYNGNTLVQEYSDNDPTTTDTTTPKYTVQPTSPIMGYSYDAGRGLWWLGRSAASGGPVQDDMAVIARAANGFGYRTDDHGDSLATADALLASGPAVTGSGIIATTTDLDYFSFQSLPGSVSFTLSVNAVGPTLDATLELRDASDTLLASRDTASLDETLTFTIPSTGNYYLVVRSHGSYGDVGQYTLAGTVVDVPLTPDAGGPYTVAEGASVQLSAAASLGHITTYEWDLDYDGVTFDADKTGASPTVPASSFDGPSTRTVALRVTDSDGNTDIATATLAVTNANPTASLTNSGPVAEGSTTATVSLTGATDPSSVDRTAGLLYSFDFDNDGTFDVVDSLSPTATIPASLVADGPATHVIRARVADKDGGFTDYTTTVTVTNRPPTATFDVPASVPQGSDATLSLSGATDPSPDDLAAGLLYSFDFNNDGTYDVIDSASPTSVIPAAVLGETPGTRTVRARIKDRDGAITLYTASFSLTNAPPTATPVLTAGDEGSDLTVILLGPSDPSAADTAAGFRYSFDFNNDGAFEVLNSTSPAYTRPLTDQGTFALLARITDRLGGHTDYLLSAAPANVAPTSSLANSGPAPEGSAATVSFGAVADPSTVDTTAGFTYSYDFDDDGTFEVTDSPNPAATVPASFLADGPFVRTVRARVADKDGGFTDYTTAIAVLDVAPTLVTPAAADGRVVLGTGFSLSLAADDPGSDTVSSWTVEWGDGRSSHATTPAALFSHDYDAKGDYAVQITAADEDGSGYTLTRDVRVTSDPPTASFEGGSLTPDDAAFQFTLTYDDDLGVVPSSLDDADVSVTGPHGPAQSVRLLSAIPTASGRGVIATYAATGPAGDWGWQDDGAYTVTLNPGQITDFQGDAALADPVGTFYVNLAAPVAPDLVAVYAGPVTLRPTGNNTATVNIYNRGSRNLKPAKVTTSLYLSHNRTWDPSDTLLASSTQKFGLVINAYRSVTFSFPTPAVPTTGKYYLIARADPHSAVFERDERNNATASNKVPLKASRPDVTASLKGHLKHAYRPGQALPIHLKLTNHAAAPTGPVGVKFVLSADSVLDDSDLPLLTQTLPGSIAGHASSVFNLSAKLPADAAGHTWRLLAVLTNAAHDDTAVSSPFSVKPIR